MATTITPESKGLVTKLIIDEFQRIDFSLEYIYGRAPQLIRLSESLGLSELANELRQIN